MRPRAAISARPPEVAKTHGVSAQTIYGWRKHFGTLEPADVKRLRQLEQENERLKKVVAAARSHHRRTLKVLLPIRQLGVCKRQG